MEGAEDVVVEGVVDFVVEAAVTTVMIGLMEAAVVLATGVLLLTRGVVPLGNLYSEG